MNIQVFPNNTTVHKIVLGKDINDKNITIFYKLGNQWKSILFNVYQRSNGTLNLQIPKLPVGDYYYKIVEKPYSKEIIIVDGMITSVNPNVTNETPAVTQIQSDWAQADDTKVDFIKHKPTIEEQVQSDWSETDNSKKSFIQNKPTIPDAQIQSDWTQTDDTKKDFVKHKPTIPDKEDITFEYRDIDGTDLTYALRVKSTYPFTINALSLIVDEGSLAGITVKINGVNVTGLVNITATTTLSTSNATAANTVSVDGYVTLVISGTRTSATKLIGELHISR